MMTPQDFMNGVRTKANGLKSQTMALYFACRRPDVGRLPKLIAIMVVGYALSPIDLIPDFIPILGYVDDLILLPLGIALVIRMIPPHIMEECRVQASKATEASAPRSMTAAVVIVLLWMIAVLTVLYKLYSR